MHFCAFSLEKSNKKQAEFFFMSDWSEIKKKVKKIFQPVVFFARRRAGRHALATRRATRIGDTQTPHYVLKY
jgi:hypothetical protein